MAQVSALTAGQDSGHPATALCQAFVADGVNAAVDPMQSTLPDAMVDRLTTEAKVQELRIPNDAVLPPGNRRDRKVGGVRLHLFSHSEYKCKSGPNPPP